MPNNVQLIPILKNGDQEQWVDARTLHRFMEVGRDFSNWIKDYIKEFGFVEGRDFSPNLVKSTGGRQAIDYSISLDMAKHLAMLQRSEKGMQARQYFINAEKELRRLYSQLFEGYDEMSTLISQCQPRIHEGQDWYEAAQLRSLAGYSMSGGQSYRLRKLKDAGEALKLPVGHTIRWYIHRKAINKFLGVKPSSLLSVAVVKLINVHH